MGKSDEGLSDSRTQTFREAGYHPVRQALLNDLESSLSKFKIPTETDQGNRFHLHKGTAGIVNDHRVRAFVEDGYHRVGLLVSYGLENGEFRSELLGSD